MIEKVGVPLQKPLFEDFVSTTAPGESILLKWANGRRTGVDTLGLEQWIPTIDKSHEGNV